MPLENVMPEKNNNNHMRTYVENTCLYRVPASQGLLRIEVIAHVLFTAYMQFVEVQRDLTDFLCLIFTTQNIFTK